MKIAIISLICFLFFFVNTSVFEDENAQFCPLAIEYSMYAASYVNTNWIDINLIEVLVYPGSDIPAAKMLLYDNNVLVLESSFFSKNFSKTENRFFHYVIEDNTIKLQSIDLRYDSDRWLKVEEYHLKQRPNKILSVNPEKKSVLYDFSNAILYSGFYFFRDWG